MSNAFPDSINIPGAGAGAQAPPGPLGGGGGQPGAPDTPEVEQMLRQALDLLTQASQQEEDDQDTLAIQKAMVAVQSVLGTRQKENEAALGTTPAHKALGRATKAGGGGGGY